MRAFQESRSHPWNGHFLCGVVSSEAAADLTEPCCPCCKVRLYSGKVGRWEINMLRVNKTHLHRGQMESERNRGKRSPYLEIIQSRMKGFDLGLALDGVIWRQAAEKWDGFLQHGSFSD